MSEIANEQYKEIAWFCPNCGKFYPIKRIALKYESFYSPYLFCNTGCGEYFFPNGKRINPRSQR